MNLSVASSINATSFSPSTLANETMYRRPRGETAIVEMFWSSFIFILFILLSLVLSPDVESAAVG
jgi:hypothetical protein